MTNSSVVEPGLDPHDISPRPRSTPPVSRSPLRPPLIRVGDLLGFCKGGTRKEVTVKNKRLNRRSSHSTTRDVGLSGTGDGPCLPSCPVLVVGTVPLSPVDPGFSKSQVAGVADRGGGSSKRPSVVLRPPCVSGIFRGQLRDSTDPSPTPHPYPLPFSLFLGYTSVFFGPRNPSLSSPSSRPCRKRVIRRVRYVRKPPLLKTGGLGTTTVYLSLLR